MGKNIIFKEFTGLFIFVILLSGIWFSATSILQTSSPLFVVSSGSMIPTFEIGDIIIVNGRDKFDELKNEDIIVFNLPTDYKRVIVHRVHEIKFDSEQIKIKTKGDNNPYVDGWTVIESNYIGKVITKIPYIGNITIWVAPPVNYYLIFAIILIMFTNEVKQKKHK